MTTTFVGSYVFPGSAGGVTGFPGDTTVAQCCADWSSSTYFNRTIAARRHYINQGGIPSSIPAAITADISAGRRCNISVKPDLALTTSDRNALDSFLSSCKTAGLNANVALWHEPFSQGLTTSQYAAMIAFYGPTVRKYYWLFQCNSSSPIASGKITASTYLNACPAGSFDGIAFDVYTPAYETDSTIITQYGTAADNAGLPLAYWEFNGNTTANTQAQITSLFNAIKNQMSSRLSAGKPCGDILLFDVTKTGDSNCQFIPHGDFRIPLVQAIYDACNGVSTTGPSITTSSLPTGTQGTAYSGTLTATGGSTPYSWAVTSGALPAGLSLASSTGVISGTPTVAPGTTPTFTVTDHVAATNSKAIPIVIGSTLAISTSSLPGGTQGSAYTTTLAATGGTSPYTWAATTALPAGLSLSTGGVLSGTPTAAGTSSITFQVTDSVSTKVTKSLSLTVTASSGSQQTVTLPFGTTSWTAPSNITSLDSLEIWGAGASGAGPATTTGQAGGGGGGGAYAKWTTVAVTGGTSYTVVTGAGGGQRHGSVGQDGGASSITIGASTYTASGGSHGLSGTGAAGGAGGAGGTVTTTPAGVTSFAGGGGAAGTASTGPAGGGGSSAGNAATGNNGSGGTAGAAPAGGAAGGAGGTSGSQSGADASSPGGGGGGGFWNGTTSEHSGAGGNGQLVLKYTPSTSGPAVTTASLPNATQGQGYSQALAASGGTTPYSWALLSGSLPAGMSLSAGTVDDITDEVSTEVDDEAATALTSEGSTTSTGVISGTPTGSGTSAFVVQVTDAAGLTATASLSLTVTSSLAVSTLTLPSGVVGQGYTQQLAATGGTPPYTWALTSGTLPPGITAGTGGLIDGTITSGAGTYAPTFTVTDALSATASQSYSILVLTAAPSMFPLSITVTLLINGTWTDISQYCYVRDGITITGGRQDEGSSSQPAQATITLNNRDGRFSPLFTGGAYYPYLKRDTQIQIAVTATSSSGNFYSGFRFTGVVAKWPPLSDISGNDVYTQITANGPLRRLRQGGGKGSALANYYAQLTGSYAPVAYWPCEEDPDADIVGAGVDGGQDMTVTGGTPKWKAVSNFNGSAPVGVLNGSTWTGITGSFGTTGDDLFTAPGTYQWVASTPTVNARVWGAGGGGGSGGGVFLSGTGDGGGGGGGGEFAAEATLAVTPGQAYTIVVGAGGSGGTGTGGGNPGTAGGLSQFAGDLVTVTAHGGKGGKSGNTTGSSAGGAGGTGSANSVHHNGGQGNFESATGADSGRGQGGGSSAGTTAAGNGGSPNTRAGNTAPTGGGAGGDGGNANVTPHTGADAATPGGGGGGGAGVNNTAFTGGDGGAGQVELIYTPTSSGTLPPNNVLRFILWTPSWGGNDGKVICRATTSGTVFRLDVMYGKGGKLRLKGTSLSGATLFDSGTQNWAIDGQAVMVSAELAASGSNVHWTLKAILPGKTSVLGSATGTFSGSLGNVTEVFAAPNGDITKSAMGHISVQYALIDLVHVSKALDGHHSEMGVDRFIRLCNEAALDNFPQYAETADHWGFEDGSPQGWGAVAGTAANSTAWASPVDGGMSLLLTADGSGQPYAFSPTGTSGQPINPGDRVSVSADVFCPTALSSLYAGLVWFDSSGNPTGTEVDSSDVTVLPFVPAGGVPPDQQRDILTVDAIAPSTAQYFGIRVGNHATVAAGTKLYIDNVRAHPKMGEQTREEYHKLLEHIEKLDQGILHEARDAHGFKYKTRFRLINQTPAITLDYSAGMLSPPLAPVIDDQKTVDDITVHRHKGSKVRRHVTPVDLVVRRKKNYQVVAEDDKQLAALAQHLLNLGTVTDERYPTITVDLTRASIAGNALAPLMSAVAGLEIGDFVQMINLPSWFPSSTAKQLVIGYSETINVTQWTLTLNCIPESPFEVDVTSLRRW